MKLRIRLIRSNPPRRYCTKHVPARLAIPYWPMCSCLDEYIAALTGAEGVRVEGTVMQRKD